MNSSITPRIFVSHRHAYKDDYWNLKARLDNLRYAVHDSSWHDHRLGDQWLPNKVIAEKLSGSIRWCNIFIIVARPATTNSDWCQWEVEFAEKLGKPIVAYSPEGMFRLPTFVTAARTYYGQFTYINKLDSIIRDILQ
jgi:hypothetical protein